MCRYLFIASVIGLMFASNRLDCAQPAPPSEHKSASVHPAPQTQSSPVPSEEALKLNPRPVICDVEHKKICYNMSTACFHPRHTVFRYYGKGEIVAGHNHAACRYEDAKELSHEFDGYPTRMVILLQRSTDGGVTWPCENNVVVYDETISEEKKKAFLYPLNPIREHYDMFSPDSLFYFGRTYLPKERGKTCICYVLRSPDRGHTWEKTPTVICHPDGPQYWVHKDGHPVVRMPDHKTLLAAMTCYKGEKTEGGVYIYASTDHGVTWSVYSHATPKIPESQGRFTYAGLLLMPDHTLQLYTLHIADKRDNVVKGVQNAICLIESSDGGKTWGKPRPIVCDQGRQAWGPAGKGSFFYRSPWPMILNDGRILVLFARRIEPMGIGGVVSADGGKTWSEEFVVRDDGGTTEELGYPVGAQMEDGRIIILYYFTVDDGNAFGGTRHIAQSTFRLK